MRRQSTLPAAPASDSPPCASLRCNCRYCLAHRSTSRFENGPSVRQKRRQGHPPSAEFRGTWVQAAASSTSAWTRGARTTLPAKTRVKHAATLSARSCFKQRNPRLVQACVKYAAISPGESPRRARDRTARRRPTPCTRLSRPVQAHIEHATAPPNAGPHQPREPQVEKITERSPPPPKTLYISTCSSPTRPGCSLWPREPSELANCPHNKRPDTRMPTAPAPSASSGAKNAPHVGRQGLLLHGGKCGFGPKTGLLAAQALSAACVALASDDVRGICGKKAPSHISETGPSRDAPQPATVSVPPGFFSASERAPGPPACFLHQTPS